MKTATWILAGAGLALLLGWPQAARADSCSNARPMVPLMVVVQPEQPTAPGRVVILSHELVRGPDTSGTKCISTGSLGFQVQAPADDQTPPDQLGYLLELTDPADEWGRFSLYLEGADGDPVPFKATDGWVWFNFSDRPERSVDWTFRLAAVDEEGNQGEWSEPINITHPGKDFGCATGGAGGSLMFGLLCLALLRRRGAV